MALSTRTFRLFVSSTFSDLKEERNALQEHVFPRLRELCAGRGCRFQAVDLRWGVSEEAALDQQTMKICLDEIARCQRTSPRPNFIVLLGSRYGWRPLPAEVLEKEFKQILSQVSGGERGLLEMWYRLDENAVPPVYCLQPRVAEYKEYTNWASMEQRLHTILETAARRASLHPDELLKYTSSATEQEIMSGALRVPDARSHVFGYFREIEGLPQDRRAAGYIDLDASGMPDSEAARSLYNLKSRLKQALPDSIHSYASQWSGSGPSLSHLDRLCQEVYHDLETIILQQLDSLESGADALELEVGAHEDFGQERLHHFVGREDALKDVTDYLFSDSSQPLVVWGDSGCGKSAFMAKAVEISEATSKNNLANEIAWSLRNLTAKAGRGEGRKVQDPEFICRYVGASPESTTGRGLLHSLCWQIIRTYDGDEDKIPTGYKELVNEFHESLTLATPARPLFIFLDALDQLSEGDNARSLGWMPIKLPANVKLVVSILPDERLNSLKSKLPKSSFVQIKPMSLREGETLLSSWLAQAKRTLQAKQKRQIQERFQQNGLPLYLKLAFEEARRWKSYDPIPDLAADIPGMIRQMLSRLSLEANHGQSLVKKCLGYLAASRNGLSEDELLDILALDEAFIDEIQSISRKHGHELRSRRVPVVLWSRLYFDLEPYLAERSADGAKLMGFYHRQVGEVVAEAYLSQQAPAPWHQTLAQYFKVQPLYIGAAANLRKLSELAYQQTCGELWSDVSQTLCDLQFIEAKCIAGLTYDLVWDYDRLGAGRIFAGAPVLTARLAGGKLGLRCPYCQASSELDRRNLGQLIQCPSCSAGLQANTFFVEAAWEKSSAGKQVSANSSPQKGQNSEALAQFSDFIHEQAHILAAFPELTQQQAVNQPDFTAPAKAAKIILGAMESPRPWLRWINKPQQRSACLMTLDNHRGYVTSCAFSPDGSLIVSAGEDKTLRLWVTATGEERLVFRGHKDVVTCCVFSPTGETIVSGSADNTLKIWEVATGVERATLTGHTDWVRCCAFSPDGKRIVSGNKEGEIKIWDAVSGRGITSVDTNRGEIPACAFSLDGRLILAGDMFCDGATGKQKQVISSPASHAALSPDGKFLVLGYDDGTLKLWDAGSNRELASLPGHRLHARPSGHQLLSEQILWCAISPDAKRFATTSFDKTVKLWDVNTKEELATLRGHTEWVKYCTFSPDGRLVASTSGDGTIKLWSLADALQNAASGVQSGEGHTDQAFACDFSPDGTKIVTASLDYTLKLWEANTGKELSTLEGHTAGVTTCAFSPDGRHILSGSNDQTVRLWESATGEEIEVLEVHETPVRCCVFSPDGSVFASAEQAGALMLWDAESREQIALFECSPGLFQCAISPDNELLATSGAGGAIRLWDLQEINTDEELAVLEGHEIEWQIGSFIDEMPGVYCCAFSPDGSLLLSGASDTKLILWDLAEQEQLAALSGHTGWVRTCAFSPNGELFVSAGGDSILRLWRLASQSTVAMFCAPGIISCARVSPGGDKICCTDVGGNLHILAIEGLSAPGIGVGAGEEAVRQTPSPSSAPASRAESAVQPAAGSYSPPQPTCLAGHRETITALAISPDGQFAVSGSADCSVRTWDLSNRKELHTLSDGNDCVGAVAVSSDSKQVLTIGRNDSSAKITVWDVKQGVVARRLTGNHPVHTAAFTCDGQKTLVIHDDLVHLWDVKENKDLYTLRGELASVVCAAVTPDGRMAALGCEQGSFQVWDLERKAVIFKAACDPLRAVAVTPDGKRALSADIDCTVRVWDLEKKAQALIIRADEDDSPITALSVAPDSRRLVSASESGNINLWNLETGELLYSASRDCSFSACAMTSDGKLILAGDTVGRLHLIGFEEEADQPTSLTQEEFSSSVDVEPSQPPKVERLRRLSGHNDRITGLAFSPDGRWLVSGSADRTVRVWDMLAGETLYTLSEFDGSIGAVALSLAGQQFFAIARHTSTALVLVSDLEHGAVVRRLSGNHPVQAAAFTVDGQRLLVIHDDIVRLWDIKENKDLRNLKGEIESVVAAAITPDGRWAVLGCEQGSFQVWDLEKKAVLYRVACDPLRAVAVTPDGKRALSADTDCTVRVWDLEKLEQNHVLSEGVDEGAVMALAVTPNSQRLVSASENGAIRLWDLESGESLYAASRDCSFSACAVSSDGTILIAGDSSGELHIIYTQDEDSQAPPVASGSSSNTDTGRAHPLQIEAQGDPGDRYNRASAPLIAALKNNNQDVRNAAVDALTDFKDDATTKQIAELLATGNPDVCESALDALLKIRTPRAAEMVVQSIQFEHVSPSLYGVVLGVMGEELILEPLIAALQDESEIVRRYAAQVLSTLIMMADSVESLVNQALKGKNNEVRSQAINALHQLRRR